MLQRGPTELRNARFLTFASLRWVVRHRAWTPWYLIRYWRFLLFKVRNPHIVTRGLVFLDRRVEITARRGYGRIILGRWLHLGAGTALRCHEGTLTVGDKTVLGGNVSVNCYLDVEIGGSVLFADDIYVSDFDHKFADLTVPIDYHDGLRWLWLERVGDRETGLDRLLAARTE